MIAAGAKSADLVSIAAAWETAVEHIVISEFCKDQSSPATNRVADRLCVDAGRVR